MNKKVLPLLLACLIFTLPSFAQKSSYFAAGGEMIFSYGDVSTDTTDSKAVVRWSPVFNFNTQLHFNFSKSVGIYTGLGLRNVGLITHLTTNFNNAGTIVQEEVTVKERSYSLGLPLALKLGNMEQNTYLAVGAEAELMFAYKRKIIQGDGKQKLDGWFNDNVNIFNPSAFAEMHFHGGAYVRFKYYLDDFLNYQGINLVDENLNQSYVADYGPDSPLFYVSIGIITSTKQLEQDVTKPTDKSAYFKQSKKERKNLDSASSY